MKNPWLVNTLYIVERRSKSALVRMWSGVGLGLGSPFAYRTQAEAFLRCNVNDFFEYRIATFRRVERKRRKSKRQFYKDARRSFPSRHKRHYHGYSDALCGAFGTWKIPMGACTSVKARVTCKKCRALLDAGRAPGIIAKRKGKS